MIMCFDDHLFYFYPLMMYIEPQPPRPILPAPHLLREWECRAFGRIYCGEYAKPYFPAPILTACIYNVLNVNAGVGPCFAGYSTRHPRHPWRKRRYLPVVCALFIEFHVLNASIYCTLHTHSAYFHFIPHSTGHNQPCGPPYVTEYDLCGTRLRLADWIRTRRGGVPSGMRKIPRVACAAGHT